ncbi:phosphocarrier protein HPr [Mycoplasmoides pneumoniae]|uniref:Phosphocarrier protein HPr n=4 Tax=Mycoplasmoides pneumoniae TaxID=2104 RepID=PTHP_MYCPN|nr:phosphocarrier protein HPr [Mycoplasmoides pneumoniae]P75061.1 RecName: Full=Phosphocarrier protein HPr; AltName: Full=Histidine-containing protein [Mycoplasmoides pneumoniae M129]AAB95749.1 phosphocarrier protein HPr [Mycoplasmoides pneumoniae M129]ADK86726.1 Phosphocarrier protein HPr [Mycoplasmoides pneumoniae FH]AGC03993.1 phosphocarrier protein HPr [Mycoplasmoides pneumoniae M129-B7]ALA29929.1 phosphocarrier protein HPr [Mycoplasmoides pneumoniae PI 1428]ALA30897.1 phosphocarrier prot
MKKIQVVVKDPVGIHARPASIIAGEANKFKSELKLVSPSGVEGNIKSIINLMSLGIKQNDHITIKAEGTDEEEALNAIKAVLEKHQVI